MDESAYSERFALVLQLTRQVTSRHDLDDVLTTTLRRLRPLVDFGGGSIQLVDDDGWIQMAAADPVAPPHVLAHRVPLGTSVAGRIVLTEKPVYLPDLQLMEGPGAAGPAAGSAVARSKAVSAGVRSYFGVPLLADGAAIGVLQVDSPERDAWTEDERDLFLAVAPIVASSIQNARAHAREQSARTQAAAAKRRLQEARQMLLGLRAARDAGDSAQEELLLATLESVIGAVPEVQRLATRMPQPRLAVG
jgi:GAF domain-containing protein